MSRSAPRTRIKDPDEHNRRPSPSRNRHHGGAAEKVQRWRALSCAGLSLSLDEGHFVADDYEGQPAPHVSNYIIDTWVDGKLLNVMVSMGTNQPTSQMATAANEELARLCVPAA